MRFIREFIVITYERVSLVDRMKKNIKSNTHISLLFIHDIAVEFVYRIIFIKYGSFYHPNVRLSSVRFL